MFDKILLDEKCVTEIFLNNDCLPDGDDLFQKMVKCLYNLTKVNINSSISILTTEEVYYKYLELSYSIFITKSIIRFIKLVK